LACSVSGCAAHAVLVDWVSKRIYFILDNTGGQCTLARQRFPRTGICKPDEGCAVVFISAMGFLPDQHLPPWSRSYGISALKKCLARLLWIIPRGIRLKEQHVGGWRGTSGCDWGVTGAVQHCGGAGVTTRQYQCAHSRNGGPCTGATANHGERTCHLIRHRASSCPAPLSNHFSLRSSRPASVGLEKWPSFLFPTQCQTLLANLFMQRHLPSSKTQCLSEQEVLVSRDYVVLSRRRREEQRHRQARQFPWRLWAPGKPLRGRPQCRYISSISPGVGAESPSLSSGAERPHS
jgi:hypothetical protein